MCGSNIGYATPVSTPAVSNFSIIDIEVQRNAIANVD
jgi:galactose-1-phosphate uridylyltransferase